MGSEMCIRDRLNRALLCSEFMPGAGHTVMNRADPAQHLGAPRPLGEAQQPSGQPGGSAGVGEASLGGGGDLGEGNVLSVPKYVSHNAFLYGSCT